MISNEPGYHIGFSRDDLGEKPPIFALLSGDPERARRIAKETRRLHFERKLSEKRGLNSYVASFPNGQRILSVTSGMGAPSLSIVVNELFDVGIRQMIRIGTCGSIQDDVKIGSVVISRAALCRQGAANDIAPVEYPAAANPFLTVALVNAARRLDMDWHIGITASVDTFYEGQERILSSANKHVMRWLDGINEEYRHLNVLNYEMESGTLFKMASVYGFAAACICAVVADRTASEGVVQELKKKAEEKAINIALEAVESYDPEYLDSRYRR
jgi:uridine phosphorylase